MSATGLDVFDKTLNTTNMWLDEIVERLGPDRKLAWKVLSVVLHKLRDRVPIRLAAHLGAELPLSDPRRLQHRTGGSHESQ